MQSTRGRGWAFKGREIDLCGDLLGFFEPFIPVRRPGWEWVEWMDCAA